MDQGAPDLHPSTGTDGSARNFYGYPRTRFRFCLPVQVLPAGRKAVLAQSFAKRAASYEEKRDIVPRFAARTRATYLQMVRTFRAFQAGYRRALDAWRAGVRDVVFPHGTYWMVVHHHAPVKPPLAA